MRRNKSKDDIAKLVRTEQRKTRKRYTCQICCMDILPGSQRMLYTYKSSAGYITFSNHIHCDALLRAWDKKIRIKDDDAAPADATDAHEMREDIWKQVCSNCEFRREFEPDGSYCSPEDIPHCPYCIQKVLPPSMVGAALDSLQENDE